MYLSMYLFIQIMSFMSSMNFQVVRMTCCPPDFLYNNNLVRWDEIYNLAPKLRSVLLCLKPDLNLHMVLILILTIKITVFLKSSVTAS